MRDVGGTYTAVFTSSNRTDTTFTDNVPNTLKNVYSYKLAIEDVCGNITYTDSTPTHSTINLSARAGINKSVLNWTPYAGWRVKVYHIYRQDVNNPGKWIKIADVSGDSLHYDDTAIICYQTHQYKILADEYLGNQQSSWSDTATDKPIYVPNVLPNEMIRVTVDNNTAVEADWLFSLTRRPWLYYLERSYDNINYVLINKFDKSLSTGMDPSANVHDTSYYYRMRVQDSCGDFSIYTSPMKTILLKINMDSTIEAPVMSWTRYQGWPLGVGYYEVQWYDESTGTWKTVGNTSTVDSQFTDRLTYANQNTYCYRIVAYDRDNHSIISVSNVACMPTMMHVYVPNVFSPNIDAKNEIFNAKGVFVFDYNMRVYDRWGELLYETNDMKAGWDGTFHGRICQEGVYIYVVKAIGSGAQYYYKHGNVTLIR
jgi:gliding motility-associated-like protein